MIECHFCQYSTDKCDVCDGFGWFLADYLEDACVDVVPAIEVQTITEIKSVPLEEAIAQNPIHALHLLEEWFKKASESLSASTGSSVFYEDIANTLVECDMHLQQLVEYEKGVSGEGTSSCMVSMWNDSMQ